MGARCGRARSQGDRLVKGMSFRFRVGAVVFAVAVIALGILVGAFALRRSGPLPAEPTTSPASLIWSVAHSMGLRIVTFVPPARVFEGRGDP